MCKQKFRVFWIKVWTSRTRNFRILSTSKCDELKPFYTYGKWNIRWPIWMLWIWIKFLFLFDPSFYLQKNCDNEKCRKEAAGRGENKAVNCKVSCCETDQCNIPVVSRGQVSSISILGLIISLLSCYSFQNYKLMSFQNYKLMSFQNY